MSNIRKSMASLLPSIRLSFILVTITSILILIADTTGILPNHTQIRIEKRKQTNEMLTTLLSIMATNNDIERVRLVLTKIVLQRDDLLSAGIRMQSGQLQFEVGDHINHWRKINGEGSTSTHILVPISNNNQLGTIELTVKDPSSNENLEFCTNPTYQLIIFVFIFSFLSFLFFIIRTLRETHSLSVIPDRVNAAFDSLSEGLVILDDKEQIVLANKAFCEIVKKNSFELLGFKLSELNWKNVAEENNEVLYPWLSAMSSGNFSIGELLVLELGHDDRQIMTVNCAPMKDSKGNQQGMLITFGAITQSLLNSHASINWSDFDLHT